MKRQHDFDTPVVRRNTHCVKWDCEEAQGAIPMWVADMDFRVAQPITEALMRRVEHGVFGYTQVPDAYYDAIIRWFESRHAWHIDREWIIYTSGVVPALSAVIKALTLPGDKVLLQTPVYNCFFSSVYNNGCQVVENLLQYGDNTYHIDFDDLERKAADPKARLLVLCNPHNPAGRVWTAEELRHVNDICQRNGVRVVSDEIHCELVMPGYRFIPFASVSKECLDNSVTLNSPSKSWNIAGLQIANIICSDSQVRERIDRAININEVCDVNPFGVEALMAAYNESGWWIDQLCGYLKDNYDYLRSFVAEHMPKVGVTTLEGTYLVWLDIRPLAITSDEATQRLLSEAKVMVNSGTMYGDRAGEGFIRVNIACPRSQLISALESMSKVLAS